MNARRLMLSTLALALCALAFASAPVLAAEIHVFSSNFGSFTSPQGVAVNQATGHVYVADGNGTVDNFEASGAPDVTAPQLTGAFLVAPVGVAVDNSARSSKGDIYVADSGNQAVDQYNSAGVATGLQITAASVPAGEPEVALEAEGVAVDSDGNVYVACTLENVIDEFSSAGVFIEQIDLPRLSNGAAGSPQEMAFDSANDLYVATARGIFELDPSRALHMVDPNGTDGVAVDGADDMYAAEGNQIAKYDPSGALVERFGAPSTFPAFGGLASAFSVAVNNTTNRVYVSDPGTAMGDMFDLLTVPDVATEAPSAVQQTSATLRGSVNPDGTSVSACQFEWGTEAGSYPNALPCAAPGLPLTGSSPVAATVELTGLAAGYVYHYRLSATNENATIYGRDQAFESTPLPPTVGEEFVSEVAGSDATLHALVNPGGGETTYHFDYGTSTAYGLSTPESATVGNDHSEHQVSVGIQGLSPDTTYHYRIVATNSSAPGGVPGSDQTFTTQSSGGKFVLPDGRAYELVSPVNKEDGEVLGIGGGAVTAAGGDATQASEDGRSVSYTTSAPVGVNPPSNTMSSQIFSARGAGGWASRNISIPHPNPVGFDNLVNEGEEYLRFSADLSHAIVMSPHHTLEPPLAPEIHQEVGGSEIADGAGIGQEIYIRDDMTETFRAVQATEPLRQIVFEGASPDLSHIVFEGPAGLDQKYPLAGGLYEWTDGQTQLVSVLPDNKPASGRSLLGENNREIAGGEEPILWPTLHAVSDDGSRVLWSNAGSLYSSDVLTKETELVGNGLFQVASGDGSRVFYTNNGELFVFDVVDNKQVDLGVANSVVGANEEGTVVYEKSSAVLPGITPNGHGESASEGANNLYVLREMPSGSGSWSPTFITSGAEEGPGGGPDSVSPLATQDMRVSPNGDYLAFMSQQRLTAYDNRDANSGQPDEEVYVFDRKANTLACASCDPTGARPVGEYDEQAQFPEPVTDPFGTWAGHWIAAAIPGWTPDGKFVSTGYQPRFLSDAGRLFFDSVGGLAPQDINGRDDVYQYEPVGVGSCQSPGYGLSASVVRDLEASGCVGLISAGTGSTDSVFFDASASGNDVFFTTQDGLVSQDQDGTADMYDARVCTAAEPCASSLALPPACTTTDSCRAAPSPQPGVFAAPASATFAGAGNSTATTTKIVKTKGATKAETRARELARALRACKKRPAKQRPACKARARKRFGGAKTSGRRSK
ncbi:MAG TPA: NHL repeat-containing protein [Solirubrobacteraceae bacterium]|nr:NHL repeat-containing protein [Solirubrobacteraceae bacterium]